VLGIAACTEVASGAVARRCACRPDGDKRMLMMRRREREENFGHMGRGLLVGWLRAGIRGKQFSRSGFASTTAFGRAEGPTKVGPILFFGGFTAHLKMGPSGFVGVVEISSEDGPFRFRRGGCVPSKVGPAVSSRWLVFRLEMGLSVSGALRAKCG